ncbi:protein kinase [Acidobacteria bacterium AH-259-O06]|nr:protein kinase [Acidobacteria bacterium AH-259-O06]
MPSTGDTFNHYEILRPLGKGGMGEVFLAQDTVLERKVALKFLPEAMQQDPIARKRFLREAKAAAALDHPFICKIYETGEAEGTVFIAMEYVEGETLKERSEKGPLSLNEGLQTTIEIAEALEVAHKSGIVHRDLKPSNIMLTPQGHAKVMDFGLAKRVPPPEGLDSSAETFTSSPTEAGTVLGTLPYMSPEQARGEPVDLRSDIFSFGVLLQEILSGEHPFMRGSGAETLSAILRDAPPPLYMEATKTPAELERILQKALAKDPAERYQSTKDLASDLRHLREATAKRVWPPIRWPLIAAGLALVAALLVGTWWFAQRSPTPAATQELVSVLIADFENHTGDPVFDGALEQTLAIGLEGAPFITTYNRGKARRIGRQLQEGAITLDETLARLVAQREGINVIVSGFILLRDEDYNLSAKAIDAITGKPIVSGESTASSKDRVLAAVGKLAARTRNALGDTTPESVQLAAAETFTAASLEAAHNYALAQDLQGEGKFQEAIPDYLRAVELDPSMGRAYAGLAVMYRNLGQREEAEKYYQKAMALIDRMTNREKYRTRGGYYVTKRNYQQAIEEFSSLVEQYPADFVGRANLALAYFFGRNMARALEEGRRAVDMYPTVGFRANLALYAMYAGDFEKAVKEASAALERSSYYEPAHICKALSKLGQSQPQEAVEIYQSLATVSAQGASFAASGLADLALYEGRLSDAITILEKGIAADLAKNNAAAAARKSATLSSAYLAAGQTGPALEAADQAVTESKEERVLLEGARVYLKAGREVKALQLASKLGVRLEPEPQVYAKLIEGEVQLNRGSLQETITLFRKAQDLLDTWLGRFDLGRAYVEAGAFTEAYSQFEACLKRRGEATAVFLDDLPTFHYFPPIYYYLGRAQEGLKSPAAAESYRTFLAIKEKGDEDPLIADARRRLGSL